MFNQTVDSVLSSFRKQVEALNKIAQQQTAKAATCDGAIETALS